LILLRKVIAIDNTPVIAAERHLIEQFSMINFVLELVSFVLMARQFALSPAVLVRRATFVRLDNSHPIA
jgi:hypothetical protein